MNGSPKGLKIPPQIVPLLESNIRTVTSVEVSEYNNYEEGPFELKTGMSSNDTSLKAIITKVSDARPIDEMTEDDAAKSGFFSQEEHQATLRQYASSPDAEFITLEFEIVDPQLNNPLKQESIEATREDYRQRREEWQERMGEEALYSPGLAAIEQQRQR